MGKGIKGVAVSILYHILFAYFVEIRNSYKKIKVVFTTFIFLKNVLTIVFLSRIIKKREFVRLTDLWITTRKHDL